MCVPDIILLELRDEPMNGVEVLAQLRKEPSLRSRSRRRADGIGASCNERAIAMAAGFTELPPSHVSPGPRQRHHADRHRRGTRLPQRHSVLRAEPHLEIGRGEPMQAHPRRRFHAIVALTTGSVSSPPHGGRAAPRARVAANVEPAPVAPRDCPAGGHRPRACPHARARCRRAPSAGGAAAAPPGRRSVSPNRSTWCA